MQQAAISASVPINEQPSIFGAQNTSKVEKAEKEDDKMSIDTSALDEAAFKHMPKMKVINQNYDAIENSPIQELKNTNTSIRTNACKTSVRIMDLYAEGMAEAMGCKDQAQAQGIISSYVQQIEAENTKFDQYFASSMNLKKSNEALINYQASGGKLENVKIDMLLENIESGNNNQMLESNIQEIERASADPNGQNTTTDNTSIIKPDSQNQQANPFNMNNSFAGNNLAYANNQSQPNFMTNPFAPNNGVDSGAMQNSYEQNQSSIQGNENPFNNRRYFKFKNL